MSRPPRSARGGSRCTRTIPARWVAGSPNAAPCGRDRVVGRLDAQDPVRRQPAEQRGEDRVHVRAVRRLGHALDDVVDADEQRGELRSARPRRARGSWRRGRRSRPCSPLTAWFATSSSARAGRRRGSQPGHQLVGPALLLADRCPDRVRVAERDVPQGSAGRASRGRTWRRRLVGHGGRAGRDREARDEQGDGERGRPRHAVTGARLQGRRAKASTRRRSNRPRSMTMPTSAFGCRPSRRRRYGSPSHTVRPRAGPVRRVDRHVVAARRRRGPGP